MIPAEGWWVVGRMREDAICQSDTAAREERGLTYRALALADGVERELVLGRGL
jgi:hypothetical protein